MKLLCCGKLFGDCKWASFYFQQAIGVSRFAKLLSFGKLLGICKGSALLKRFISGRILRIRNLCKSDAVLHRFAFPQAIGDSQSMKLLSCGRAIGDLQIECFLKVLQCFFMSNKIFLIRSFCKCDAFLRKRFS